MPVAPSIATTMSSPPYALEAEELSLQLLGLP
jgi:hypothetical protein